MILNYRKGMHSLLIHDPSQKMMLNPGLIHDLFLPHQNITFWLLFYSLFILLSRNFHCFKCFGLYMWETPYSYIAFLTSAIEEEFWGLSFVDFTMLSTKNLRRLQWINITGTHLVTDMDVSYQGHLLLYMSYTI